MSEYATIGRSLPRIDATAKAAGAAQFTNDLVLPGMLHGKLMRSPHPHARILNIDTSRAQRLTGVKAILTGKDTAGIKYGVSPQTRDELALAIDKVRYVGDEVAAVAALDEDTALEALDLIQVDYEVLPAVFDPEEAMREGAPQIHDQAPGNISIHVTMDFGDVEKGFRESDYVREDRFSLEAVAHCQIEPYVAVAHYRPTGYLDVWVPNQSPFTKRRALANTLRMPMDKIAVRKVFIGGAFGGRSEMLAGEFCAALLSQKTGKPVKVTYDREETFLNTRQKHPFIIEVKAGLKKDGTFMARSYKVLLDGGAYCSTGALATANTAILVAGLYRIPNFRYEGYRVYTNKPVRGAMKGQGSQQVRFADECQLDTIAKGLGIDPVEIRLKNAVHAGDTLVYKSKVFSCGLTECIEKAALASGWREKKGKLGPYRGIGVGCSPMICGFNMGARNNSAAFIKFNEDGQATLITGVVDNGQGNETMVAQIAAEELGIPLGDIRVVNGDTEVTPSDPGTYSMTATLISGNAVKAAAADAKRQLMEIAAERLEANVADLAVREGRVFVRGSPENGISVRDAVWAGLARGKPILGKGSFAPSLAPLDSVRGKIEGQMTGAYSFGSVIAEVEVDPETGQVGVTRVAAAHDCGLALNPQSVEGQIEGGVVFSGGQVLTEGLHWDRGHGLNPSFLDYRIATAMEAPQIQPIIVESHDPVGPFGAKEAAETVGIAIVPAIANAIHDAMGVRIDSLPITPEKVLAGLKPTGA